MPITNEILIKRIAEYTELSAAASARTLDALRYTLQSSLARDEDVRIAGLGRFVVGFVEARTVLHPKTRQPITTKSYRSVRFRASQRLKDAVI